MFWLMNFTSIFFWTLQGLETFAVVILRFTKPIGLKNLWYPGSTWYTMIFSSNTNHLVSSFAVLIGKTVLTMSFLYQIPYKRFELNQSAFGQRWLEKHVVCFQVICVSWLIPLIIFCRQPNANWHVSSSTNVYIGMFFVISTLKMIWCLLVCYCCANHCKTYFPRSSIKVFVRLHEKLNLLK